MFEFFRFSLENRRFSVSIFIRFCVGEFGLGRVGGLGLSED